MDKEYLGNNFSFLIFCTTKGFLGGAGVWEGCFLVGCLINYDVSLLQDSEILQFEESGGPKRVAKRLLSKAREQVKIVSFSLHKNFFSFPSFRTHKSKVNKYKYEFIINYRKRKLNKKPRRMFTRMIWLQ